MSRRIGGRAAGEGAYPEGRGAWNAEAPRRSWFRRSVRFVAEPFRVQASEVGEGWAFIEALWRGIRFNRRRTRPIRLDTDGRFDTIVMARDALVTQAEIERQLDNRRRETRGNAIAYLLGGAAVLAFWLYEIATQGISGINPLDVALFLAVVGCLFALAFHNAFLNWQVRTRRLGSVRQFFSTEESWWPR